MRNPQNLGELAGADAVGTVGNSDCGEMLRMWVKFKQENGKKVIDRATFQSFGCETAIAVASLATELIRGKTPEEALALKTEELAGELGPLLQFASSKTDAERLLLISPELADAFSAITCRIRRPNGTVALVNARYSHERIWMPPGPTTVPARPSG